MPIDDPVLVFAVVALLILLAPFIMERLRLPGMVGLLLAGAVLGPNALGVLARDRSFELLGTVGLIYIMFTAALEIDLAAFKRYRKHSVLFGLATFAVPQGIGLLAGHYLLGYDWPAAILLGSLFASHTLVAYPIASRLGIARSLAVTSTVGATMITDTLALLVLAVIAGSARGDVDGVFWVRLGLSMVAYFAVVIFLVPRLGRWFYRHLRPDGVSEFAFVLAVVFAVSSLAHVAGVEPIVGAFLAGLALNRLIPHGGALMNRIHFTGEAIFVPFFLLSVGMLLDVRIFTAGARSWAVALTMLTVVIAAKWAAAHLTRRFLKVGADEANVMFGLSVAQAAATLAATLVGFDLGVFDEAVVNGAILMILGTCILAPLVVARYGRRVALAVDSEESGPREDAGRTLVALSPARPNDPMIELVSLLRAEHDRQPIHLLSIIEEGKDGGVKFGRAERVLAHAVHDLAAADIPVNPVARIDLNVAGGILRARKELGADHVVIGWSGHAAAEDMLFGSFVDQLLRDPEHTLIVTRLERPVKLAARVLLLLPPNAIREPAFQAVAGQIKTLAKRLARPLLVFCERGEAVRVAGRLSKVRPAAEHTVTPLESWSRLLPTLADTVTQDDLLICYAGRTDTLSYRFGLDALPGRLAHRFAETNLVVVHPAVSASGASDGAAGLALVGAASPAALPIHQAALDVRGRDVAEVVAQLLEGAPPQALTGPAREVAAAVAGTAHELIPGVVLVHATDARVARTLHSVGVSRGGFVSPLRAGAAHVLFLVLDPPDRDAEGHLQTLGSLARVLQRPGIVQDLCAAQTPAEVLALLGDVPVAPSRLSA